MKRISFPWSWMSIAIILAVVFNLVSIPAAHAQDEGTVFRPKGYMGFVSMGLQSSFVGKTPTTNMTRGTDLNLRTSHGYKGEWLFFGAGLGVDIHKVKVKDNLDVASSETSTYLPIFLNGRVYFSKSRNAVYFDLKGGYALADAKGGFLEPSLGLSCALGGGVAINMALTFEWLRVEYSDNNSAWGTFYEKDHINTSSIGFTVGLEF